MSTSNSKSPSFTNIVFYGSYIFLMLSVLFSVVWYSDMDTSTLPKHEFNLVLSLIPFILSTLLLAYGNYVNMKDMPIVSNKKLSVIGSILNALFFSAIGYAAFMVIKAMISGS